MTTLDELTQHYQNGDLDDLSDEALRAGILLCDDASQRLYNRFGDAKLDDVAGQLSDLTDLSAAMQSLLRQRERMQATVTM